MSKLIVDVPSQFNFSDYELQLAKTDIESKTKLNRLMSMIGYKTNPVSIETFMTDPYYLGNYAGKVLRNCWKYGLTKMFPNQVVAPTYLVFRGAIGTGKSFVSKCVLAYDIYKMCCMEDPFRFFGLLGDKLLMFKIFHVTKYRAQELTNEFWEWIYGHKVPFFDDELRDKDSLLHKIALSAASSLNDIVGGDVISVWFSEFNELSPDFADTVLSSAVQRFISRFMKCTDLFGHVILDSSDKEIGCPIDRFLQNSPYSRNALIFSFPKWVATPELYFKAGTFKVYAGDSEINPHILIDGEDTSHYDQDRIIEVPDEARSNFEANIELALQELAGVSLAATDRFLDPMMVEKYCTTELQYEEDIKVDFFDANDILIDQLKVAIDNLPVDRYIFVGLDLAVKHDRAGLAIGYVDEIKSRDINGIEVREGYYKFPIVLGISRYPGQETSINKIQELILNIHSLRPIKEVVTDQYQSTQLLQTLAQMKIPVRRISVDRDDKNPIIFKNLLYSGKITLPNNSLLKRELKFLKHIGNKVDHPIIAPDGLPGGKDCTDAMMRTLISMIDADVDAMDIPRENTQIMAQQYEDMLNTLTESANRARILYSAMAMIRN
jgi:hypothetical protein